MKAKNWKEVWESRGQKVGVDLAQLIRLNGFDSGKNVYDVADWMALVDDLVLRAGIHNYSHVLEVGCGCGALIEAISFKTGASIHGYDYSESQINIAKSGAGDYMVSEAVNNPYISAQFDVVLSHSVFQYFPDLDYARTVIETMAKAAIPGGRVLVMDVPESDMMGELVKRDDGLRHLHFNRQWLRSMMTRSGLENVQSFPHAVRHYGGASSRFNLIGIRGGDL